MFPKGVDGVVDVVMGFLSHTPLSSPITGLSIRLTAAVSSNSSARISTCHPRACQGVLPHTLTRGPIASLVSLAPI